MYSDLFSLGSTDVSFGVLVVCTVCSLVIGLIIAVVFTRGQHTTKGFALTLAILPAIVQMVIMLVNGNVGTGVAVMGAFSLVRFRSAPGSARDICAIFLAMAAGLACGTQHLSVAIMFTLIICIVSIVYTKAGLGSGTGEKALKITIPESLDYDDIFDELLDKYTKSWRLEEVKTTNMGSLYKLHYAIVLKDAKDEKKLIDELRSRNGNLEISCGREVIKTIEQL